MGRPIFLKIACASAALAMTAGIGAPAFAGGGKHGGKHYRGHHQVHHGGHYRGHRGHYRRHHRHGGDGALVALGVIGGLLLLDAAIDESRRDDERYYRDYDRRHDNERYGADPYGYRGRAFGDDRYDSQGYRYDSIPREYENETDGYGLEGGPEESVDRSNAPAELIKVGYDRAYEQCAAHARSVLRDRGLMIATPAAPLTATEIGPDLWRMTANFSGQAPRGRTVGFSMRCDADQGGVRRLELI